MFPLSGKMNIEIPCFPCAVATLKDFYLPQYDQDLERL